MFLMPTLTYTQYMPPVYMCARVKVSEVEMRELLAMENELSLNQILLYRDVARWDVPTTSLCMQWRRSETRPSEDGLLRHRMRFRIGAQFVANFEDPFLTQEWRDE